MSRLVSSTTLLAFRSVSLFLSRLVSSTRLLFVDRKFIPSPKDRNVPTMLSSYERMVLGFTFAMAFDHGWPFHFLRWDYLICHYDTTRMALVYV